LGSAVTGSFGEWTAEIAYSETPDADGKHGDVTVTISIASLSLGSVTQQAMGADFFNTTEFPTAVFAADLVGTDSGPVARGTLTIRDQSVPVEMPFDLTITGDNATAKGTLALDRRNFNIGNGVKDEKSLGFGVDVSFDLTAVRAP
jgi:polyisoprenoid-binding protein YceI